MELSAIQIGDYSWELIPHTFEFRLPAGTSRGVMHERKSVFIRAQHLQNPDIIYYGEFAPLPGLSPEWKDESFSLINLFNKFLTEGSYEREKYRESPAFCFAIESILLQIQSGIQHILFQNTFSKGESSIPINGLVWMGEKDFLIEQIQSLILRGFNTIKMKISFQSFERDLEVLRFIRERYIQEQIQIRVDANGSFPNEQALSCLESLGDYDIHSIEQPITPGQWKMLREICKESPVKIALDEELIGLSSMEILYEVKPHCIILKPSLHGGLLHCKSWIENAEKLQIQWWITSALESNIGLNAIAQFAAEHTVGQLHGLGTGQLFTQNIPSPLELNSMFMHYAQDKFWDFSLLNK